MQTATFGVIFVGVWLALVLLYCLFKGCGGRFIDILSCDCFSGACFDCWGAGGTIDRFDREYPFQHEQELYTDPPPRHSQLPIIIVNSSKPERHDSDDESDSSSEDSRQTNIVRDPELREEADGALLLRSSSVAHRANEPTVV